MQKTIVLIGCGNMGYALLCGWLRQFPDLVVWVVEPAESLHKRAQDAGAALVTRVDELPSDITPELVIVAVKPQIIDAVLADCGRLAETGASFVSVAAGVTMDRIAANLPGPKSLIRCMPNTPASIGAGAMGMVAGDGVTTERKDLTEKLFAATGTVTWIDDESLMDAVTAISGSGPAYVFYFIEALAQAGEDLGLPAQSAQTLALQTLVGASQLAAASSDAPGALREQVTSPGGTTAAALGVLMAQDGLLPLLKAATTAARDRGAELGRG
jgi:pyrroline-5-carboxylate reductase